MSLPATTLSADELQKAAREHLWLHFTRMSGYEDGEVPIIVRGDGCYLEDSKGKRYLDALAGLFAVNIGYGYGEEMGEAAAAQMRELPFYTNWSYAHPRAIELAAEVASLAPGDLSRASPAEISGQNNANSARPVRLPTSQFEKNILRSPCAISIDCRNELSAASPSTSASTIGASG